MTYSVTATATGGSSSLLLPSGSDWVLSITSSTWGDADLQGSVDGTTFIDVEDKLVSGSVVNLSANKLVRVSGGMYYRLDVNTYSADITIKAKRCTDQ